MPPAPLLLAGLVPEQPAAPASPPTSRVELGFRDGTTTELEPSSVQAQALQELAQLLRARD